MAHRLHPKPRLARQRTQFAGRPESSFPPKGRTEPASDAPRRCPGAPFAEFADDEMPARTENAGNFAKDRRRILDEAKNGNRHDHVKAFRWKRYVLRRRHLKRGIEAVTLGALLGGFDHRFGAVDPDDMSAAPREFGGKIAISAPDI